MRTLLLLFLLVLCLSRAFGFDGPLQVKNQFPIFVTINTPSFERAALENSLSASVSYSSIYLVRESSRWSAGLDMEIAEFTMRLRKTIRDFVELGIDLPIITFSSGCMDGFLNKYHDTFGFPDYGRSQRPDNAFLYEVKRDGALILRGENGRVGLADVRLSMKKPLFMGDPAVSIRCDIEFPTGDAEAGFGNGTCDVGLTLLIDKRVHEKAMVYMNLGGVLPGDLKAQEKIDLDEFLHVGVALEAMLWKNIGILGQVLIQGSPFPKTDIGDIDRTALLLSLGGRYRSGSNSFEVSVTEDLNTAGAPDVMLSFALKASF